MDLDIGWLAGIIDGEGCLSLRILFRETKGYGIRPRFAPQLTIVNTDEEIITKSSRILSELGVQHRVFKKRENKPNVKQMWCIDSHSTGLRVLLPIVKDQLCKKEQAEILLKACEMTELNTRTGSLGNYGRAPMPDSVLEAFDEMRERLSDLHGRQSKSLIRLKAIGGKRI